MTVVLWRESWLKPLTDLEIGTDVCTFCNNSFQDKDFVTSCEFCSIGVIHDNCARDHIIKFHKSLLNDKIKLHKDKRLHDYQ